MQPYVPLMSRLLLAPIFLVAGFGKITGWEGTLGYMESQGLPFTSALLVMAAAVEIVGGLAILLGFETKWASLALIAFLIPTTLIFHDFWAVPLEEQQLQQIMFLKNIAIMGGLLSLAVAGAGAYSVDYLAHRERYHHPTHPHPA